MAADPAKGKDSQLYDKKRDNLTSTTYDLPVDAGFCREKKETRARNRFHGKIAIVTGGAGNFGAACADRLVSEGCNVALWDIKDAKDIKSKLDEKYKHQKPKISCHIVDVTDESKVQAAVDAVVKQYGRIDLLFNNGMFGTFFWCVRTNLCFCLIVL